MPIVRLGNEAALDRGQLLPGNRITTITILDEDDVDSRMRTITHPDGLWPAVSMLPPKWVECDDSELEMMLAGHYGIPIGQPDDSWE